MKNIHIAYHDSLKGVIDYCTYNRIQFNHFDLWDDSIRDIKIPDSLLHQSNQLLVIDPTAFRTLYDLDKSQIINFCNNGNCLWVYADTDSAIWGRNSSKQIFDLDSSIVNKNALTIFFDGYIDNPSYPLKNLKNIRVELFTTNFFFRAPRIKGGQVSKYHNAKDFMVTMILKDGAFHRKLLWDLLIEDPILMNKGIVSCRPVELLTTNWIGDHDIDGYDQNSWQLVPSMDLYRNAFIEIVPETLYENVSYITEKTTKALLTKTPFLIVSTPRYLKYLRSWGFKTFNSLIDESYDNIDNVEDRVKKVVQILKHIISNGSYEFYQASNEILEHNQRVLFELAGRQKYEFDQLISKNLEKLFC